jgi:hypothetical protein
MARDRIPIVVLGNDGRPLAGASVTVRNHPAGTTATVYSDDSSGATLANPLTSDARGGIAGWVERGMYAATITASGFGPIVEYFAAAPARDGDVDTGWLTAIIISFEVSRDLLVAGEVRAPSGDLDVIPAITVPILGAQSVKFKRLRARLPGPVGASLTVKLQRNGVDIAGVTGAVSVAGGAVDLAPSGGALVLANNDRLQPIVSAPASTPQNLELAAILEINVPI